MQVEGNINMPNRYRNLLVAIAREIVRCEIAINTIEHMGGDYNNESAKYVQFRDTLLRLYNRNTGPLMELFGTSNFNKVQKNRITCDSEYDNTAE